MSIPVAEAVDLERARSGYELIDRLGWVVPLVWAGVVLPGVVLARRRLRALALLSFATAVGAGLVLLGVFAGRAVFAGSTERAELAGAVWDVVTEGLRRESLIVVVVALVVAILVTLVAWGAPPLAGRRNRA